MNEYYSRHYFVECKGVYIRVLKTEHVAGGFSTCLFPYNNILDGGLTCAYFLEGFNHQAEFNDVLPTPCSAINSRTGVLIPTCAAWLREGARGGGSCWVFGSFSPRLFLAEEHWFSRDVVHFRISRKGASIFGGLEMTMSLKSLLTLG